METRSPRPSMMSGGPLLTIARAESLSEQVELVFGIVDEVDAVRARGNRESKERTTAGGCNRVRGGDLGATMARFDDITVASVHGENVTVGRERQSERLVQQIAGSHGHSRPGAREPRRCVLDFCDTAVDRIGDVE